MYFGPMAQFLFYFFHLVSAYRINVKSNHAIMSCLVNNGLRWALANGHSFNFFCSSAIFASTWQKTRKPYASRCLHTKSIETWMCDTRHTTSTQHFVKWTEKVSYRMSLPAVGVFHILHISPMSGPQIASLPLICCSAVIAPFYTRIYSWNCRK